MTRPSGRLSVVVPCYNAGPYLGQALGSALDQHRRPDEIIVVDDGSTDESLAIARRFAVAEPDVVRVYAQRSGRASRTRNLGAMLADGDALMFLDADDVIGPDTLGALEAALSEAPGGIAACSWYRMVLEDGDWMRRPRSCAPRREGQDPLAAWLTGWYYPPCAVLWSRDAFESAGRWDEEVGVNDDGDLVMRALAQGRPLAETTAGAAYYRRRGDGELSLSGQRRSRAGLCDRLRVVRKIAFWLRESGRLDAYRAALSDAFGQIAADASSGRPDLARQARALARHYRPPRLTRAGRAFRQRGAWGDTRPQSRKPQPAAPVAWGAQYAERVFALADAATPTAPVETPARPAVSVIVPTFNRADLLPRAIASVRSQTFGDFELIVVDDGSTDGTEAVVAGFPDTRVRYLQQPHNAGVAAARNRGIRAARADLVAFLDSDDEWLPDKLARQVAVFHDASQDLGLVYTGVECVLPGGGRRIDRPEARGDVYRQMLGRNVVHGGGSNVMMRRSVVATVGFFDERLSAIEDYEYWLRIARFFRVEFVDAPLIRYYDPRGPDRRSQALRANLETREWFFQKHAREMRQAGVAHLFLLKSMRRALGAADPDVSAARRLALRAVREAPTSRAALAGLLRSMRSRAPARAEPLP